MFILEDAIKKWKQGLAANQTLEDGYIAELESHLRDKVENLVRTGMSSEEAFLEVTAAMGQADDIGREFYKAYTIRRSGRPSWQPPRFMPALIWNCTKVALRKIRRQKGYSFINIIGLAVGLAGCILITLWVRDELSYDRYHEKAGRIYRLASSEEIGGIVSPMALVPYPAAPAFAFEIPEIEAYVRLLRASPLAIANGQKFDLTNVYYSDPDFFKIFTHAFLSGDPGTALAAPGSVVLTDETARKLFGRTDVLGKTLNFNHENDLRVTGVIRTIPHNAHFQFSSLAPISTIQGKQEIRQALESWQRYNGWSYLLLKKDTAPGAVEKKMAAAAEKYVGEDNRRGGTKQEFQLQKLTDIHLRSHRLAEIGENGDIRYIYMFSLIAAFILVIACVNFMNLATARSANRGKEVGLRKVLGACRKNLVFQFLGESVLMSLLASAGAIVLVVLALPSFNRLTGKSLGMTSLTSGAVGIGLAGLAIATGLVAGSYPALFLSAFRPVAVLKGALSKGMKRSSFRSALVVLQFSVSIILLAGMFILLIQMKYMKSRDLGFDKDQVLVLRMKDASMRRNFEPVKAELLRNPNITGASLSGGIPGRITYSLTINLEGRPESESHDASVIFADFDFVKTYGIKIVRGRDFSKNFSSDVSGVFLINETAAKKIGWEFDAVGRKIGFDSNDMGEIVGVMKDFHYASLKDRIGPLVVRLVPGELSSRGNFLSLKLRGGDIPATVDSVKSLWSGRSEREFEYFFADENFDSLYRNEERVSQVITAFAVMAIFIACLGLFGLASFAAEQRTKEIGVRKVLGASEMSLAALLSKEFLKWVLLANMIALPASYVLMMKLWLSNFAYRTNPRLWIFASVAAISLLIALLTVCYQAVKAALANPVDSLRYE
jgi:putative ABC transport system permease protein